MKHPNNPTGNQIRDLQACSAVNQPTAPPYIPLLTRSKAEKLLIIKDGRPCPRLPKVNDKKVQYFILISLSCG
jgi:hypothetical protein